MSARLEVWVGWTPDGQVALVVPYDDEQVRGLLVHQRGENPQIEQHAPVGVEGDDLPMRQADGQAEGLGRHTAEHLMEQARLSHVRSGVVPLIHTSAKSQDDQLVFELGTQNLHTIVALHRTTSPARTTAAW